MEYISAKEVAKKWKLTERSVQLMCAKGQIFGAKSLGKQWLIPANAVRPDRRTKYSKILDEHYYHFPIFIQSGLYNSTTLNDEEKNLLKAQRLYLEGEYLDSLIFSKEIANNTTTLFIKVGAYATICYDAMLLGLYTEYKNAYQNLEKLVKANSIYSEDYKLILAGIKFNLTWKQQTILDINASKLSYEALTYYQALIMLGSSICLSRETKFSIRTFEAYTKTIEYDNITPLIVISNLLLAVIFFQNNVIDRVEGLVNHAIDVAIKNGMFSYVAKFYPILNVFIDKHLNVIKPDLIPTIQERTQINVSNWRIISRTEKGNAPFENVDLKDIDLLVLLSSDFDIEKIAIALNSTAQKINDKIKALCKKLSLKDIDELIVYANKQQRD